MSSNLKTTSSLLLAASVMALASVAQAAELPKGASGKALDAKDDVHCYNVHSCKGKSDCKTSEHACKGQNACKGHGFKALSAQACLSQNGTIADL